MESGEGIEIVIYIYFEGSIWRISEGLYLLLMGSGLVF